MNVEGHPTSAQRAFGAGRLAGLALAGIPNPEKFVNARKLALAAQALNGIALKIYEAVPIAEAWTLHQITAELARLGSKPGPAVVEGSVHKCVGLGLVKLIGADRFQRVDASEAAEVLTRVAAVADSGNVIPIAAPAPDPGILNRLAALGQRARYLGRELEQLAADCDAAALDAEEQLQRTNESAERLSQLKALLSSL